MDPVTSRPGRVLIHVFLLAFAIYSVVPFLWTALQSIKKLRDASSRTPKFLFSPTLENYENLWLRSTPENPEAMERFSTNTVRAWSTLRTPGHRPGGS